jgi:hypothetical protein
VRTWWLLLTLVGLAGNTWVAARAVAQELHPPGVVASPPSTVEEVKPSGFYLRNEKGELVYVPDVSYEQFEQLLKIQRNLTDLQQPAFVLTDMAIDAVVTDNRLDMDVTFTLQGRELEGMHAGTWFHVPLRFDNAFLCKEPEFEGPGGHFLTFDGVQDGYVCWLQMGADAVHKVTLRLLVPVDQVGDESRIALSVPTPLASTLRLKVPEKTAEGMVKDLADAAGRPLAFESTPDGQGQFTSRGIRGDVSLSWHGSRSTEKPTDVRLDVLGEVVVTADEMLQEIHADGRFNVRGFGGPIESFQVRLPAGMRLRESQEPGYSVRPVQAEGTATTSEQVVEVRLDRPTAGEVDIQLLTEIPTTPDDPGGPLTVSKLVDQSADFEPAKFEFIGAVRHHGHIDLVVRGDWAFEDRDDPDFPRVGTGAVPVGPNVVAARYRYHNQQRSLKVSIRQKATRISVEPTYKVYVDSQQARLIAELVCRTSGSKAGPLAIRLPFWTVEIVRFVGVDSPLPVDFNDTNPLVVPIPVEAQALKQFTLKIEARQDLTASVVSGTGPLRVVLPLLEATNPSRANVIVSPATVMMIPADNILLTPRPQQMKALSALVAPNAATGTAGASPNGGVARDDVNLPGGEGTARFYYRDRGPSDQAVFVGDVRIQPRAISVRISSTATVTRTLLSVEQRLSYMILHEPAEILTFTLPESFSGETRLGLRLFIGDQPLIPTIEPAMGNERPRVRVRLPQPTLGPVELRVVHPRQPMPGLSADADSRFSLPLLFPSTRNDSDTTIVDNTLTVLREDPLRVETTGGAWILDEGKSGSDKLVLATTTEGVEPVLQVSLRGASPAATTVVHQIWIQSWVTREQRRDRAVFRVRTRESQLRVILPQPADAEVRLVKLAVDHHEVTFDGPGPHGEIVVPVAQESDAAVHEHVVEVWYVLAPRDTARGNLEIEAAAVDAVDRVERTYWQVILPGSEIVVSRDPRVTPELRWQWDGFGWRRHPSRDQVELEQWIDASRQDPVPPGTNRYLFTAVGAVNRLELATTSRSWILLDCSGVTLAVGLLLLYVPLLRHPVLLLAASVVTITAGMMWPEFAILFAQAAILGALLAVMASVCRRMLWRLYTIAPTVQGRAQFSDSKIKGAEQGPPRADGSSKVSATSAPMSVEIPAAEFKS